MRGVFKISNNTRIQLNVFIPGFKILPGIIIGRKYIKFTILKKITG